MKFFRKFKPSRIVAKKEKNRLSRAIEGALVRIEPIPTRVPGGKPSEVELKDHLVMYVTNNFCIARLDLGVKDPFDEPGPVPAVALRHIEQGVNFSLGEKKVRVGITEYDRVFVQSPDHIGEEKFPDWEDLLDRHGFKNEPTSVNKVTLDLNPELLLGLAQAIGSPDSVTMTFDLRGTNEYPRKKTRYVTGPVRVQGRTEPDEHPVADAYLMPMRPIGVDDMEVPRAGK